MMKLRTCLHLAVLLSGVGAASAAAPESATPTSLAITHVTVIDPGEGAVRPNMTVAISGGTILKVTRDAGYNAAHGGREGEQVALGAIEE